MSSQPGHFPPVQIETSVKRQHVDVAPRQTAHGQVSQPGAVTYGTQVPSPQNSPGEQFFPQAPQFV